MVSASDLCPKLALVVMRDVLSALPHAVIGVDADGALLELRSPPADALVGEAPVGAPLWTALRSIDRVCARWMELAWPALRDPLAPFDLARTQLPTRLDGPRRSYELSYAELPHPAPSGTILVTLGDIAASEAARRSEHELRQTQQLATRAVRDPSGMRDFLEEGRQLVSELAVEGIDTSVRLRLIHTLKGNAALLGLERLAERCHQAEQALLEGESAISVLADLRATWQSLDDNLTTWLEGQSRGELDVTVDDHASLLAAIEAGAPYAQLADIVSRWRDESVARHFDRLGSLARSLAARLGKGPVIVDWEAEGLRAPAHLQPFWSVAAHLIRNALDHGIEPADARRRAGKSPGGRLHFQATRADGGELVLSFSDDGRGVDFDRLAAKRGPQGPPVTDPVELLFEDGLSAKDGVDETSGRGVGMSAVRATVERLGGSVDVSTARGEGTTFTVTFPPVAPHADGLVFDEDEDGFLVSPA